MDTGLLFTVGVILVVVGIIVVVAILGYVSTHGGKGVKMRGAGVVMIGPIPIVFGTDKKSVKEVLTLAIALTVIVFVFYLVFWLLR